MYVKAETKHLLNAFVADIGNAYLLSFILLPACMCVCGGGLANTTKQKENR